MVIPRDSKEKATWAKAEITRESLSQEDILKNIQRLHKESKRTVLDKKSALMPFQRGQVARLLDECFTIEMDPNFQWSLAQLHQKEITNSKGHKETTAIIVYLKRSPLKDLNPIGLFNAIERNRRAGIEWERRTPGSSSLPEEQQERGGAAPTASFVKGKYSNKYPYLRRKLKPRSNSKYEYSSDEETSESSVDRRSTRAVSLPTTISVASAGEKEEDSDTNAIFKDHNLLSSLGGTKGQLITAFAAEILLGIEDDSDIQGSATRVSNALPDLLKEFSQELSHLVATGIQKDAASFVHRYRE
jgi:hypothetical protein